jgi:solute carrier family 25 aspartate/glutamate transporter 12/13
MAPAPELSTIHADSDARPSVTVAGLRKVVAIPDNELKRWRRTFETNAIVVEGEK